jgi:DNA-binding CsgD family transcriptional regulator
VPELLRAGDLPAYRANVARLGLLARRSGQPLHQWYAELFAAQRALVEGDVADAAIRIEAAAAIGARLGTGAGEIYRLAQLLVLRRDVGGLADLLDPVQAIADRYPALVTLRLMVAVLHAELGFAPEAADGLGRIAADGFAAVPPDSLWTTTLCYAAEVAHAVHDPRTAKAVADRLEPYRGSCAVHGIPVAWGAVDRAVGLARLAAGEGTAGGDALRRALDLHQRWGFRALVARTRVDLADALGGGGEAQALADQAASEAAELGLSRLAARAQQLGKGLQASGPPPLAGPGGTLSPREMEVLQLIAAGVSNAGIAARLVLSINTVERHVRNVYAKLGVTNRAEATALATRAQVAASENSRSDHGFR